MDLDPATETAGQLARAISGRELSSRELLDHLLDRAGKINPQLNAIVAWDTERARAAADAADAATMRGEIAGPFLSDLRLLRLAELVDAAAGPGFTPRHLWLLDLQPAGPPEWAPDASQRFRPRDRGPVWR